MTPSPEPDPEFRAWLALPGRGGYEQCGLWEWVGSCPADDRITVLADMYLKASPERREQIRAYFRDKGADLAELWVYVRRVALLIRSEEDVLWLRRGLAAAAIEGGGWDFRDTIVSLVILRYAAERAGIRTRPFFDEAIAVAAPESRDIFVNARDHSRADVAYTVREFGPPEWAEEVRRRGRRR